MSSVSTVSRRRFIQTTAAAAILTQPALSWGRVLGANERLRLAVIGTGGQGHHHLRSLVSRGDADDVVVIRVCDVYRRRLNSAIKTIGGTDESGTLEYREILDDREVDAVVIATPDHWHTKIAIEAMDAGKDVYCEKPLSLTVQQAIECRDAVRRTGRVLQVGPQGTSDDRYWKAREAIEAGRIGKVVWSQASYCRNSRENQFNWHIDPDAGPQNAPDSDGYVWWDRWLGWEWNLADHISWNADHFFRFRKYFAYNGGVATDLLYHKLAPLLVAIAGPNGEYPRRVSAAGNLAIQKDSRDIPDTFVMTVEYPSEHTIVLVSSMTNDVGVPDMIRGHYGTIEFGNHRLTLREQSPWWPEFRKINAGEFQQRMVKGEDGRKRPEPKAGTATFDIFDTPRRDHMGNFLDAIRGKAPLHCNIELGSATMVAIKMAVESYRNDQTLLWDPDTEKVVTR